MQHKYYVSHESQQMGPYSIDEIVSFVSEGTLSPLDYIYDEEKKDWMLFLEHSELSAKVKALKPKAPPKVAEVIAPVHASKKSSPLTTERIPQPIMESLAHDWFVLKGENKFGPFSYTDVVKMLQQGVLYEFDFAWYEGMSNWTRIAELKDFNTDHMKALKESAMPEINEVFFRRRHKRVKYGGTILIHDNQRVWKGKGVEISEGGAGVIMENAMIVPGQQLHLHFKPGDGVPPFNALCEVVSKQYTDKLAGRHSPIKYGLRFLNLNTEVEKNLQEYTKKAA